MRAFIICDIENPVSINAANRCMDSLHNSDVNVKYIQQTCPETLKEDRKQFGSIKWSYPLNDFRKVDESGMTLRGYRAQSLQKVFACTISHARLWLQSVELQEEIMILEHDALFTRKFTPFEWEGGVCGLNDPRGATHSAQLFHEKVSKNKGIQNTPWVKDELAMPQGLAGNSAYIIKPAFAKKLIDKLKEKGGWPNDSLMCKQFFPDQLKVVYPYFTKVQGIQSTTTT